MGANSRILVEKHEMPKQNKNEFKLINKWTVSIPNYFIKVIGKDSFPIRAQGSGAFNGDDQFVHHVCCCCCWFLSKTSSHLFYSINPNEFVKELLTDLTSIFDDSCVLFFPLTKLFCAYYLWDVCLNGQKTRLDMLKKNDF